MGCQLYTCTTLIRYTLPTGCMFPLFGVSTHVSGHATLGSPFTSRGRTKLLDLETKSHFTSPCVVTPFFSRSSRIDLLEQKIISFCILAGPCNQWRCKASSAMYVLKLNSKMSEYNVHKKYHWVD